LKEHIKNDDPYLKVRKYYNDMFLNMADIFETKINQSDYSLSMESILKKKMA